MNFFRRGRHARPTSTYTDRDYQNGTTTTSHTNGHGFGHRNDHGVNNGIDQGGHELNSGTNHGLHHDGRDTTATNGHTTDNHGYDTTTKRHSFGRRGQGKHGRGEKRNKRPLFDIESGYYNRRPSFGQWIKFTWLDLVTMVIMGAIGLGVYMAHPAPSRSFPVTFSDGEIVYPEFAYPLRKEIVPIWAAALMAALIPIFVFCCMQIRVRSFWDLNNAIIGLFYSLITAAVFQVFVKWLIGGLRPHFLSVCKPDISRATGGGNGFRSIMYNREVCTGDIDQIDDSLESMPSGHSTAAWAGFLYLYFYLNAKLKVFSNHHPAMWKLVALYAPILGATLITGALTIDEFHNWYDCLAGALIGSTMALSAYRMVYASVWDFRFNHIPLTRHTPFSYGAGQAGAAGFESAVFTRKAGWGYEEAFGGAPFDAAHALRGQMNGFNTGVHNHGHGRHGLGHGHGSKHDRDIERTAGTNDGYTNGERDHYNTTGGGLTNRDHHGTGGVDNYHNGMTDHHHGTGGITDHNRSGGLTGHNHADGLTDHDHTGGYSSTTPTTRDQTLVNEPEAVAGDGRYRTHRKSLERKAIGQTPPL